jgi:hypothetical protein
MANGQPVILGGGLRKTGYNAGHVGLEGDSPRCPLERENTGNSAKKGRKFPDWPESPPTKKELDRMPHGVLGIDDITTLPKSYLQSQLRRRKSSYFAEQENIKESGDCGQGHRRGQSDGKSQFGVGEMKLNHGNRSGSKNSPASSGKYKLKVAICSDDDSSNASST